MQPKSENAISYSPFYHAYLKILVKKKPETFSSFIVKCDEVLPKYMS